ncbi:hypothetical protein CCHR01_19699 [Colletotrichum chrysophilum]|uniref:Uncharacterized protein n=1 Tax=Colletotrichum chrysophilum TaxID=1836956 RepID=A0AAD9E7L2_9PEZI|nr:hypothetical protein CCHR01_19699 [Colletotrichum chrysophilum]
MRRHGTAVHGDVPGRVCPGARPCRPKLPWAEFASHPLSVNPSLSGSQDGGTLAATQGTLLEASKVALSGVRRL